MGVASRLNEFDNSYQNLYSWLRSLENAFSNYEKLFTITKSVPRSYIRHGGRQHHDGMLRTGRPLHGFVVEQPLLRSAMGRGLVVVP